MKSWRFIKSNQGNYWLRFRLLKWLIFALLVTPTVNNVGVSHENDAIETAYGSLKRRIEQANKLRGNADFASVADYYRQFVGNIAAIFNQRCKNCFQSYASNETTYLLCRFT